MDLIAKKRRILKQRLSTHDSINSCLLQAFYNITISMDTSISNNWDPNWVFYFLDHWPVACAYFFFVLFLRSAMNRQQRTASINNPIHNVECLLFCFSYPNFTKNGNFYIFN